MSFAKLISGFLESPFVSLMSLPIVLREKGFVDRTLRPFVTALAALETFRLEPKPRCAIRIDFLVGWSASWLVTTLLIVQCCNRHGDKTLEVLLACCG